MRKQASIRTSSSHPLRIDAVAVSDAGGLIGMTLCPGRRDELSVDGPWERDLTADIALVSAWKPDVVLTLVEDFEFELLGVPTFPAAMRQANLPWKHHPIRDAGIPDASFEEAWRTTGREARAILMRGGRVLDTVASIVGGMLGALHGAAAFPERWIEQLQGRDLIDRAAHALFDRVQEF